MQKIVGSIMVIIVCSVMGFEKSKELQIHLNELEGLKRIFTILNSELLYTKAPLSELFLKISNKTEGLYQEWLRDLATKLDMCGISTFGELWRNSIRTHFNNTKLTKQEIKELEQVGLGLQYTDTLNLYLTQLDFDIEDTREELKSKKKMYQTMGVMCGVFLVIVLF